MLKTGSISDQIYLKIVMQKTFHVILTFSHSDEVKQIAFDLPKKGITCIYFECRIQYGWVRMRTLKQLSLPIIDQSGVVKQQAIVM